MGGNRERRRRRKFFILLVLGGILAMAALGFHLGPLHDGTTSTQRITGKGSSELTTSTRVPVSPGDNGSSADSPPSSSPTSSTPNSPATDPSPAGGPTFLGGPTPPAESTSSANPNPSGTPTPSTGGTTGPQDDGERDDEFRLTVNAVKGLFPGGRQPLRVLFTNQYPFDVWVTDVATSVRSTPECGARHLVTGTYALDTRVHVPAGSRAAGTVPFGMRHSAPDACQGAAFDLRVSATAVRK